MTRITKIFFGFTIVWLIVWLLPSAYDFIFAKPQSVPFTLYSSVINDFAWIDRQEESIVRTDSRGNSYTEQQFDSILPLFYYRQLITDERLPDTLNGIAINPRIAQMESFSFKSTPTSINKPQVALYPLLESKSGRVDLEMPDDVFRITDTGIEFIDIADNSIKTEKSRIFTEAMTKKGFCFPAKIIAGNPTTKKEYDEGYFITDSKGALFHLKRVVGRPYCRRIELPQGMELKHIFPTEFRNRRWYAFVTDTQNKMYALYTGSYEVKLIDIPQFDPTCEGVTIFGNVLDWTLTHSSVAGVTTYAIDATTLQCIKTMQHPLEDSFAEKIRPYIMPLRIGFTSGFDRYIYPRINQD